MVKIINYIISVISFSATIIFIMLLYTNYMNDNINLVIIDALGFGAWLVVGIQNITYMLKQ